MANKLLTKLTRQLTNREALHIIKTCWGYERFYQEVEAGEERNAAKQEDADLCRRVIESMFSKDSVAFEEVDSEFDGEGFTISMVVDTINYLHKIGVLA